MANQHHPSDSGRRPRDDVLELRPTCNPCTWVFLLKAGRFWLKQIHGGCDLHRKLPAGRDAPPALAKWLTTAA